MKKQKTIYHLYDIANGYQRLAADLNLNALTVHRWRQYGIPYKYFPLIRDKYNLSVDDCLEINESILAKK